MLFPANRDPRRGAILPGACQWAGSGSGSWLDTLALSPWVTGPFWHIYIYLNEKGLFIMACSVRLFTLKSHFVVRIPCCSWELSWLYPSRLISLSPSHILSLSLPHTHTISLSHTHTISLSHTHTHNLSLPHTHTHFLSPSHTHTMWLAVLFRNVDFSCVQVVIIISITST